MRKLILILFMLPLFASGQIVIGDSIISYGGGSFDGTVLLDTARFTAGGGVYYYATSGDTVFINSDTLLNVNVSGSENYIHNQNAIEQTADFWINGNGKANTYDVGSAYKYGGVDVITAQPLSHNYFFGGAGNLTMTGYYNTGSGYQSLYLNTTGSYNNAFGNEALFHNTTGNSNTASGWDALYANTSGNANTAFGYYTLRSNTTGGYNTASGRYALRSNTTGGYNTAFGGQALNDNTTGNYNAAFGMDALFSNGIGSRNIACGYFAGKFIYNGSVYNFEPNNSVFLGANTKALADNQTNQIVIGYDATGNGSNTATIGNADLTTLYVNEEGKGKISAGSLSLENKAVTVDNIITTIDDSDTSLVTSGAVSRSVFSGRLQSIDATNIDQVKFIFDDTTVKESFATDYPQYAPLSWVQTSVALWEKSGNYIYPQSVFDSVGIGATKPTEKLDVDGNINISNGSAYKYGGVDVITAQPSNINFFFGGSGNLTMSGAGNTAVGWQSLKDNTTGDYNTSIGIASLFTNTTGYSNVAMGFAASNQNITGFENTAIGRNALQDNINGNQNTAIGYEALMVAKGNNNTAVGNKALASDSTGSLNTAIGDWSGYLTAIVGVINKHGDSSVFLGANTKAHADNETNQIVIGYDAIGNGSNTVTLGNNEIKKTALKGDVTINDTTGSAARSTLDIRGSMSVKQDSVFSNNVWVTLKRNSYLPSLATTEGRMFYINNTCIGSVCTTYTLTGDGTDKIILDDATAANTVNLISGFYICYNADDNWIIVTINTY